MNNLNKMSWLMIEFEEKSKEFSLEKKLKKAFKELSFNSYDKKQIIVESTEENRFRNLLILFADNIDVEIRTESSDGDLEIILANQYYTKNFKVPKNDIKSVKTVFSCSVV